LKEIAMEVLYILIPLAIILATAAVAAFFWSVKNGQLDDLDTPAWRAIFDDEKKSVDHGDTEARRSAVKHE
jgi:cbb3-type cytochrome oxidase maturation protein